MHPFLFFLGTTTLAILVARNALKENTDSEKIDVPPTKPIFTELKKAS